MAKKKKSSGSRKMTVSLATAAGFMPLAKTAYDGYKFGGFSTMANEITAAMTGYNPEQKVWRAQTLMKGAVPIVLGYLVHKVASRLGVNRALGSARIPFVRV